MAPIPFIGRLHPWEYLALILSFLLTFVELVVRTITLLLPTPIIAFFYRASRNAFNSLSSPYSRKARNRKKGVSSPIAQASDFAELCELYGYYAEEHVVQTKDGYLLGVHRLGWRQGEEDQRVNAGEGSLQKKVVYMHHGLLMNSEVWVCLTEKERCLPFLLVDQGYDVWLGNNRGNKYSKKSMHHKPTSNEFWDFSMDEFAFFDIPDSINYILETTSQPSLSYIGFSQGTAQAFATLSIHPTLNSKVDVFVALAPAMAPPGLASGVVSSLCKSNPEVLFLLFGRRSILSSATMWSALLYPAIFSWFIDKSLIFLFNWRMRNIAPHQKLAAYPHLYSFTAAKCVVHWFQIIRNGTFQMYDDEVSTPLSLSSGSKYYKVAKFPTRNIKTPIVLVYGGSDSLVDIKLMLKELPKHTIARGIQKYEHLDFLWASDVDKLVFPHVLQALETYAHAPSSSAKAMTLGWRAQQEFQALDGGISMNGHLLLTEQYRHHHRAERPSVDSTVYSTEADFEQPGTAEEQMDESDDEEFDASGSTPERLALTPAEYRQSRPESSSGTPTPVAFRTNRNQPMQDQLPIATTGAGSVRPSSIGAASDRTVVPSSTPAMAPAPENAAEKLRPRRILSSPKAQQNRESVFSQASDGTTVVPAEEGLLREGENGVGLRPEGWWSSTSSSAAGSREGLRGEGL